MIRSAGLALVLFLLFPLTACLAPSGNTTDQQRSAIERMHDETLVQLYQQREAAKDIIRNAAGYAVFSNVNAQYFFVGGGGGYGVAVDLPSGQRTYMKMAQAGVGLGLGVQDVRVVFVFHSQRAIDDFVNIGWEFGGQADAAAKSREKGVAATGEVSIDAETSMFTLSESGLIAKVNLAGTKYWRAEKLNY